MSWKNTIIISTIVAALGTIIIFTFTTPFEKNNQKETMNNEQEKTIREPAVAGAFYPAEKEKLSKMVEEFLSRAETPDISGKVRGLLAPHAGYPFSGPTAAASYKAVKAKEYDTVIIIGSSHSRAFRGASVFKKGAYKTPFGNIQIDEKITSKLLESPEIKYMPEVHQEEHSIEVQLPFLSKALIGEYKIVPIIIGGGEEAEIVEPLSSAIVDTLRKQPNKKVLLVASSDLSHYPNYEDATMADNKTLEAISTGEVEELRSIISSLEEKNIERAATFACAQRAIETVMRVSKELGANKFKILDYSNAGDATGDKSKVVGYGAAAFIEQQNDVESPDNNISKELNTVKFSEGQKNNLLKLARNTVEKYVRGKVTPDFQTEDEVLQKHLGVFVTLEKNGELRGCIGVFEPNMPLWKVIQEVAISAATKDARFPPVKPEELDDIKYEISVLSPLVKIEDTSKIELGIHGVKIEKAGRSGVFLPKVAKETGWGFNTFMNQICTQKMGLENGCWKEPDADIYIFETTEFSE